jgi:hypothetical protein
VARSGRDAAVAVPRQRVRVLVVWHNRESRQRVSNVHVRAVSCRFARACVRDHRACSITVQEGNLAPQPAINVSRVEALCTGEGMPEYSSARICCDVYSLTTSCCVL